MPSLSSPIAHHVYSLDAQQLLALEEVVTPKLTKYVPHEPTPKQAAFLLLDCKEALYGGAAGGGKSDALLMAALQYVDIPGYSAILFRRTFADLRLPGALMDRADEWLRNTDAKWSEQEKTWYFPSGATLTFGYLEHSTDKFRYQSAQFQFIGFDELTQFLEKDYRYMFSRLRRLAGSNIPIRMRSASNPGGVGHQWVRKRFIVDKKGIFIPARLEDNPYLDVAEYEASLNELDIITRAQLREGNWDVSEGGKLFKRAWFEGKIVDAAPARCRRVRFWDMAATEPTKNNKDPDFIAGVKLAEQRGIYFVEHVVRLRATPKDAEDTIKATAEMDGIETQIYMEQEPGSSGKITIDYYAREVLKGFCFRGLKSTGSKIIRANPVSSAAEQGRLYLVRGPWNEEYLEELENFPGGPHDDQVDGTSGAMQVLKSAPIHADAVPLAVGDGSSYWGALEPS